MKKTLIAIAALAATGAFAQSSVTMSGVVDVAYMNQSVQTANVDTKTQTIDRNGASTSALNIAAVEDLGGGMKASFFFESNWHPAATNAGNQGATATLGSGQVFLGLEGGFGAVKLGAANSAILATALTGDSFGTAVGGNYSGRFSSTGNGVGVRVIRNSNTIRYDTPVMSGFSGSYELGFANKDAAGTNTTSPGVGVLGLRYAAGPLTVAFATGAVKPVGTVAADTKQSHTLLSANYVMGAATLFAGITSYKATGSGLTADETSSMNFGVRYNVSPVLSVQASMANRKDKRAVTVAAPSPADASLLALGLNYSLSKRTTAYGRYESTDTNKASTTTGDQNGKGTLLAIGIRHNF